MNAGAAALEVTPRSSRELRALHRRMCALGRWAWGHRRVGCMVSMDCADLVPVGDGARCRRAHSVGLERQGDVMRPSAPLWGWAYGAGGAPGEAGRCGASARCARSPGGINANGCSAQRVASQMHPICPTGPAMGACRPGPGPPIPTHPKGCRPASQLAARTQRGARARCSPRAARARRATGPRWRCLLPTAAAACRRPR